MLQVGKTGMTERQRKTVSGLFRQEALQMQRKRMMCHKYEILQLKKNLQGLSRTLKVIT